MLDYGEFFLVKKIKISQHYNNDYGDYRDYTFLDVNGKKPPNWLHMQSRQFKKSFLRIYSPSCRLSSQEEKSRFQTAIRYAESHSKWTPKASSLGLISKRGSRKRMIDQDLNLIVN